MAQSLAARKADFISAALRHTRDAEDLLQVSPDQAVHLAGFGPECARKACLSLPWADRLLGHQLDDLGELLVAAVASLDVEAHRYHITDWPRRYQALARWRPECRYQRTGTTTAEQARGLVGEARTVVDALVVALWCDGRLSAEALQDALI